MTVGRASRAPNADEESVDFDVESAPVEYLDHGAAPLRPSLSQRWQALRAWRVRHVAHRALVRDLASYRTSAEIHELSAVVARYDDDDVAEIGRLLQVRAATSGRRVAQRE